jgi:ABC-type lipoprotein export system ATPase subunit
MLEMNRRRGTTLVLVTHERELAELADRQIHLRDGRVVADTTKDEGDADENESRREEMEGAAR